MHPGQCEQNPHLTSAHVHLIHEKHQVTAPGTEPRRKVQPPPRTPSASLGAPQPRRGWYFPPHGRKSHSTVLQTPAGCNLPLPTSSACFRPLRGAVPSPRQHLCPEPFHVCKGAPVFLAPFLLVCWGQSLECCAPAPFPPHAWRFVPRDSA